MRLIVLVLVFGISGCAANKVKTPPNFSAYVNNLSFHPQTSVMIHEELGEHKMNEEPLESTYKECIKLAYAHVQVNLGGVTVTDPFKLSRMKLDHTVYTMMKGLGFRMGNEKDANQALRNRVMSSNEFKEVLSALEEPSREVSKCLRDNGWKSKLLGK